MKLILFIHGTFRISNILNGLQLISVIRHSLYICKATRSFFYPGRNIMICNLISIVVHDCSIKHHFDLFDTRQIYKLYISIINTITSNTLNSDYREILYAASTAVFTQVALVQDTNRLVTRALWQELRYRTVTPLFINK